MSCTRNFLGTGLLVVSLITRGVQGSTQCIPKETSFVVAGAGVDDVNGEYFMLKFSLERQFAAYQKRGANIFMFRWDVNQQTGERRLDAHVASNPCNRRLDAHTLIGNSACPTKQWVIAHTYTDACVLYKHTLIPGEETPSSGDMPPMDGWVAASFRGKGPPPTVSLPLLNETAPAVERPCCEHKEMPLAVNGHCKLWTLPCDDSAEESNDIRSRVLYSGIAVGIFLVALLVLCCFKQRKRRLLAASWQRDGMDAFQKVSPSKSLDVQPATLIGNTSVKPEDTTTCNPAAEDDECIICLERLAARPVRVLKCNHVIHAECIDKYLTSKGGPPAEWRCPTCKQHLLEGTPKQSSTSKKNCWGRTEEFTPEETVVGA